MKHTLLLPMLAALLLLGCTKDNDPPPKPPDPCPWPEVTTEGKNTLAFKINGVEWVPCVDLSAAIGGLKPVSAGFAEDIDGLNITGSRFAYSYGDSSTNTYGIWIRPLKEGIVNVPELLGSSFNYYSSKNGVFQNKWSLPLLNKGLKLEILRLDKTNKVISGIFEAILLPQYGNDTLFITDGRFDVTYTPQ
jgi:hypothetical protein